MLDKLFMKYLTRTGIKAYWIGQIVIDAIFLYYILGIAGFSVNNDNVRFVMLLGIFAIAVVWGGICLLFWRKKEKAADI